MGQKMYRWLWVFVFCCSLVSCAGNKESIKRVEVDVQKKSQAEASGFMGKPSPVYSTSFAIRLAELALKDRGITDCEKRSVAISFCDGVYSVTFERPEDVVFAKDYVVQISADTSRILSVDTGQR